ncbi:hypothetical protein LUZ61_005813 [Rhynchospora tenuis]|uniref:KIB1-4 beta-propeller domain-containing protein n=1 Tax=Rhynchospora tenuis TaxID=198213 RepID=A0AAD5ZQI4_9POAL|nr:hypothetical protein LUZ61_005813 [Rhynchospora tenuis]
MPETGSTSASELPDWAHLPELVLHLISTKLKSFTDHVRFRAVCSSWRASSRKPCQLPWLMINDNRTKKKGFGLFYDLWESKMHKLYFSETTHMACLASCQGWLLLTASGGQEVLLLNPLTRGRIQLPPFNAGFKRHHVRQMTFSTDLTDPNCLIMVLYYGMNMIHFCRVGEPCWTEVVGSGDGFANIYDATYYDGRFYLLCPEGYMEIVESKKPEQRIVHCFEPKLKYVRKFFLQENSGVYVIALCPIIYEDEVDSAANDTKEDTMKILKWKIELYQDKFQEQSLKLKQITDTNNMALFCDSNGFYLAVCSDDWDLADYVGGNYIHVRGPLTEPCYRIYSTKLDNGKSQVVYDIDADRHIKSLTWFQPSCV